MPITTRTQHTRSANNTKPFTIADIEPLIKGAPSNATITISTYGGYRDETSYTATVTWTTSE